MGLGISHNCSKSPEQLGAVADRSGSHIITLK